MVSILEKTVGPKRFVDYETKARNRDAREKHAEDEIRSGHIKGGDTVEIKKTNKDYGTDLVQGMFGGIQLHEDRKGGVVQRSVVLYSGGKTLAIRLRSILNITKL